MSFARIAACGSGLLLCALQLGCGGAGGGEASPSAGQSAAPPLSSRVLLSGNVPRVLQADLSAPIARYRTYVASQLGPMQDDGAQLGGAVAAGGEPLVDYIISTGGGCFFAPAGARDSQDWVGSGLFI